MVEKFWVEAWDKVIYPMYYKHFTTLAPRIECTDLAFVAKIDTFKLINFLVQTLQCTDYFYSFYS